MIICLCGSTRFKEAFDVANMDLSLRGYVVISVGLFGHSDFPSGSKFMTDDGDESTTIKQMLDLIHLEKIDLCDGIFVINVGGYIGSSTKQEIDYARSRGKFVKYMFTGPKQFDSDHDD